MVVVIAMHSESAGGGCLFNVLPAAGSITPDSKPVLSVSGRSREVAQALERRTEEFRAMEMLSSGRKILGRQRGRCIEAAVQEFSGRSSIGNDTPQGCRLWFVAIGRGRLEDRREVK